jgi:all-trans-retinol dehydrogenase (NAD+)
MFCAVVLLLSILNPLGAFLWPLGLLTLTLCGGRALCSDIVSFLYSLVVSDIQAAKNYIMPSRKNLAGSVVLVTGGGSGIGRLLSLEFGKRNCKVVIWDINKKGADAVAEEIKAAGGEVHVYKCDLSSREQIYAAAELVKKDVGNVNILVNNAGIVTGKSFIDSADTMIELTMKVNTLAHFWTLKAFLPSMLEHNAGHVVTIASSAGLSGTPGLVDYCASKFAAVGIDESLRNELIKHNSGVHTTVVCPFYINTGMFDGVKTRFPWLLPILEPEYVADQIVSAVETNRAQVWLPKLILTSTWIKSVFNTNSTAKILEFLGVFDSMNDFKGRKGEAEVR